MSKTAILLANLGSPDSTAVKDVRRYLNQFLMDERVIDVPYLLRLFLVKGIITPFRAHKSAKAYQTIWSDKGSPLIHTSKELKSAIDEQVDMPVYLCMRYGSPSTPDILKAIQKEHPDLEELILFPLYPHYAMSSYETAVVHVKDEMKELGVGFRLKTVPPFYNHPAYIAALSESIRPFVQKDYDLIMFSYHGIPERHVKKTDPSGEHCLKVENCCHVASEAHDFCYRHQVVRTTELVTDYLQLPEDKVMYAFQSRLGRDPWLQPYTAKTLEELPDRGIKKMIICCPAFVSDCLETLEEIHEEGREIFMDAGGESFDVVPCLNLRPDWIHAMTDIMQTAH